MESFDIAVGGAGIAGAWAMAEHGLLGPRGAMFVATHAQLGITLTRPRRLSH